MNKKLLCVMAVTGAVACFASGVFASVELEKISAYLNHGVSVAKEGEIVDLLDLSGNKMTPITYNDSTYLPVRSVGNLLGHEIDWDEKMQCIRIDNSSVPEIIIPDITRGSIELGFLNKLIDKVGNGKLKLDYFSVTPGMSTSSMSYVKDGIYKGAYTYIAEELGVGYSYYALDVKTVDGAPADEMEAFYQAFRNALIDNSYRYVKTDEEGSEHFVNGQGEFIIKNCDNISFPVNAKVGYVTCCKVGF